MGNDCLKLGNCKAFNVTQKNGGKVRHCLHQALKITRRRYKRAGGEKPIVGSLVCARPWHGPIQSRATI